MQVPRNYGLRDGYRYRARPMYFNDLMHEREGIVHQPDVYPFAAYIADRLGCTHLIDVGCGTGWKLAQYSPQFQLIGIDFGPNLDQCRKAHSHGTWIEWDIDSGDVIRIPDDILVRSVVICSDVIEHLRFPENLLRVLSRWMELAPVCILTTPERDLARGQGDTGPPSNEHHVREWNLGELRLLLRETGFNVGFIGLTKNNNRDCQKSTTIAVIENAKAPGPVKAPDTFRAMALVAMFNEADIAGPLLDHLIGQGIDVYVIDNWSTDNTFELVSERLGKGVIGVEKFPQDGPTQRSSWADLLRRKVAVSGQLNADWFIHVDADELRWSPWPDLTLRDAIYRVDRAGYTAIDHTVIEFPPIDNGYVPGTDPRNHFRHFEFCKRPACFLQVKAWKNVGTNVDLAGSGGHEAVFEGRRICPWKFLSMHFPVRSDAHGRRKTLEDRLQRWDPNEVASGWHQQYKTVSPGHSFLRSPNDLLLYEEDGFHTSYLVERLSGVGIENAPVSPGSQAEPVMFDDPNKYARPASIEPGDGVVVAHGYQEFVLSRDTVNPLPEDTALVRKSELLSPFFGPRYLAGRTVLDLGASGGFFSFWALQNGADRAVAVEMDSNYARLMREAASRIGISGLTVAHGSIEMWREPGDVVLALALVHWIYSCTALFASLDRLVGWLADLSRYMALVEWVDPQDPAIGFFHHLDWNPDHIDGPYTLGAFEEAISKHFRRHSLIGEVSPTRKLYACFKTDQEIDLSCPLPFVMPKEKLISARRLCTYEGIDYWSCVFDGGGVIHKQATGDLAKREARFLESLAGGYFPRVIESRMEDGYSLIVLEKVEGLPLEQARRTIASNPDSMVHFARHCLRLLVEMERKGIVHRDIRPANILVRDMKPVLYDFGWAVSEEDPMFTPEGLGASERPPDGSFSDVYSMGKVLEYVCGDRHPALGILLALMTETNGSMRVTDLAVLQTLVDSIPGWEADGGFTE